MILKSPDNYIYFFNFFELNELVVRMEEENDSGMGINKYRFQQILQDIQLYLQSDSNGHVWNRILTFMNKELKLNEPASESSLKAVAIFLGSQSLKESESLSSFSTNTEILGQIYDLLKQKSKKICDLLNSGKIREIAEQKILQKKIHIDDDVQHEVYFCIESVALYILQFVEKCGANPHEPIQFRLQQHGCLSFNRKKDSISSLMEMIYWKPVCILQQFMETLKPMIKNYLNIDTLLQTGKNNFNSKHVFVQGLLRHTGNEEGELPDYYKTGKVVKLNKIINPSSQGRELISKQLDQFCLSQFCIQKQPSNQNLQQKWSLHTCLKTNSYNLHCVFEKLPQYLKPLSYEDVLSYQRQEYEPVYRFDIIQPGFWVGPKYSEYVNTFYNCGSSTVHILSFKGSADVKKLKNMCTLEEIKQFYKEKVFGWVSMKPNDIGVVGIGNCYVLFVEEDSMDRGMLINWRVLPDIQKYIAKFLQVREQKQKSFPSSSQYVEMPYSQMLLDYLAHNQNFFIESGHLDFIMNKIDANLKKQQAKVYNLMKADKKCITFLKYLLPYNKRLCIECHQEILNWFIVDVEENIYCLWCLKPGMKELRIMNIHDPRVIRAPLFLTKAAITEKILIIPEFMEKYEKEVCTGHFIGGLVEQSCCGEAKHQDCKYKTFQPPSPELTYLTNTLEDLGLTSPEQTIIELATSMPKTQKQKKQKIEQLVNTVKWVRNHEQLKKHLSKRYQTGSLICQAMWQLEQAKLQKVQAGDLN